MKTLIEQLKLLGYEFRGKFTGEKTSTAGTYYPLWMIKEYPNSGKKFVVGVHKSHLGYQVKITEWAGNSFGRVTKFETKKYKEVLDAVKRLR